MEVAGERFKQQTTKSSPGEQLVEASPTGYRRICVHRRISRSRGGVWAPLKADCYGSGMIHFQIPVALIK